MTTWVCSLAYAALLSAPCPSSRSVLGALRYAEYDIFGLAAGLATSWAVLAASSQHSLEKNFACCSALHNYAGMLQMVSLQLARLTGSRFAQAPMQQAARLAGTREMVSGQ